MVALKALAEANFQDKAAVAEAADFVAGACFGVGAADVSSLYMIEHIKSGTGLAKMSSSIQDGGQYLRIRQGTKPLSPLNYCLIGYLTRNAGAQSLATGLNNLLPSDTIRLSSPVAKITQTSAGGWCVTETTAGAVFRSRHVIVSVPTTLHNRIAFDPPLPAAKQTLADRAMSGFYAKVILVFAAPWWRDVGLSGVMECASTKEGPIAFSRDTSSYKEDGGKGGQYSITCFIVGDRGRRWSALPAPDRRASVVEHFNHVFLSALPATAEAEVPQPVVVVEKLWAAGEEDDEWTAGGPVAAMPPEVLDSEAGRALGTPFGRVHFIGAETAAVWRGYMEGAVRSGLRGAREAVDCLRDEDTNLGLRAFL